MFGASIAPAPAPLYNERDLADLADDFRRSKESLKAAGRRLTSRQASRATRASRASIESRGPLSSNEDLDLHVDLPPGLLADESATSSPPTRPPRHVSGKGTRKTKRNSTIQSERKAERSGGFQPSKRRRGFRAGLRRIFGRDGKPEPITDAPYRKPQTRKPQSRDHRDEGLGPSTEKKAAPKRNPEHAEAESSSPKEPAAPPSTDLPKNDTST